jgi:hypothetical protein
MVRKLAIGGALLLLSAVLGSMGTRGHAGTATLAVSSVPSAHVYIDGVHVGESNQAFLVDAGAHRVELLQDRFERFDTTVAVEPGSRRKLDVTLLGHDPSDPWVIAKLSESLDMDVQPFVAPAVMRGARPRRAAATLLWPARDVRKGGLVNFALEVDESYADDATLEFRRGRTVLHRETFHPQTLTTIRPLPPEVLEAVKVGTTITWGLYYEDARRPVTTRFKVVKRPNAGRQLARMKTSRHIQRQPAITRELLAATILENNRLYSEALVANLKIAAAHPQSIQPFRGIVTTLRRLDADDSELFALVAPQVAGKGGHTGLQRADPRGGGAGLGLGAWSPVQPGALPPSPGTSVPVAPGSHGPAAQGVTPPTSGDAPGSATPSPEQPGADQPASGSVDARAQQQERLGRMLDVLRQGFADAQAAYATADAEAQAAEKTAEQAEADARAAEDDARAAREALEGSSDPTPEMEQQAAQAGERAEDLREGANEARTQADALRAQAGELQTRMDALRAQMDARQADLDRLSRTVPSSDGSPSTADPRTSASSGGGVRVDPQPSLQDAQKAVDEAEGLAKGTQDALEAATAARDAAQTTYEADPTPENHTALESAVGNLEQAMQDDAAAREKLDAARAVLEKLAQAPQDGIQK